MPKSLKDKVAPRYVTTSGAKVQRYFPGKAPDGQRMDDISASESEDYDEEADESRLTAANVSEISSIAISDLNEKSAGSTKPIDRHSYSSDDSSSEGESDAETRRLLQERLQMRRLDNETDSSESEDDRDGYDANAKTGSINIAEEQKSQGTLGNHEIAHGKEPSQASDDSSEPESGLSDTDSSESADEYAPHVLLKPMFVPKSQRLLKSQNRGSAVGNMNEDVITDEDMADHKKQDRRDESIRLAAEEAARSRLQPDIDDADELIVADTDDVDVEVEFEMWRLREVARIERDKSEKQEVDAEEEDREQIQKLSEEEKNKAGLERARKQREEKALERAEQTKSFAKKDNQSNTKDRLTQDMLEYALQRNSGRKSNSKWRGYGKEDTSSGRSLWNQGRGRDKVEKR